MRYFANVVTPMTPAEECLQTSQVDVDAIRCHSFINTHIPICVYDFSSHSAQRSFSYSNGHERLHGILISSYCAGSDTVGLAILYPFIDCIAEG